MSIIAHYAIGDKSIYFPSGFRSNYSCILQRTRRWNLGCLTGLVNNMLGCRSEFNMRCQLRLAGVCQVSQTDTTTTFRSASTMICIPPRETLTCLCAFVCQARSTSSTQRTSGHVEKIYLGFLKNRAEYFQFINFVHIVNFVCMHLQQLIERSIEINELLTDNLPNYVWVRPWYNLIYCCPWQCCQQPDRRDDFITERRPGGRLLLCLTVWRSHVGTAQRIKKSYTSVRLCNLVCATHRECFRGLYDVNVLLRLFCFQVSRPCS